MFQGFTSQKTNQVEYKHCPLIQGHWKDEVWGLAMHPEKSNIYITAGDDHTVKVWDMQHQEVIGQARLSGMARAVALS